MPSVFSHWVAALGIGACFYRPGVPTRVWVTGAICSAIPDLDVIGFRYGIRYGDFWGHRGFTHSLVFAALLAGVAALLSFWPGVTGLGPLSLWAYFFLSTASHGFLDAMTDGGLGVAFFSPFNNRRYFFSWTPIRVSPIGIGFSSPPRVSPWYRANCSGFGFPQPFLSRWPGPCATKVTLKEKPPVPDNPEQAAQ